MLTHSVAQACREKMAGAGASGWQIQRFEFDLERLQHGASGLLAESELEPVAQLPEICSSVAADAKLLGQCLVVKLNGGLGTSMGLTGAKALVEVRPGQPFLERFATQVRHTRQVTGASLPFLLMNSFRTSRDSLEALKGLHLTNPQELPVEFLQSRVPKLRQDNLFPVEHPFDSELEWCPPGHGEIYAALIGTGLARRFVESGFRYAFVSNIDNLGAVVDPSILGWFARSAAPFAMEVTARTDQDKKGGHLARLRQSGSLVLRERAQCPTSDLSQFEDIGRHRFFNTNNLWLDLQALLEQPLPQLPLIVNRKPVDPTRPESTPIFQLESAMGSAISELPGSQAIVVGRERFLPVKNLVDLFLLGSDLFEFASDGSVRQRNPGPLPQVQLDPQFFGTYHDFRQRVQVFPDLSGCQELRVLGDYIFGNPQVIVGNQTLGSCQ